MRKSAWRLAAAALLFVVWIGYLAYLAWTTRHAVVLSRPQFLVADYYVVADLVADGLAADNPAAAVTVTEWVWPNTIEGERISTFQIKDFGSPPGWEGPGRYILALQIKGLPAQYELTPLPRTPGFPGGPGRIYKATPSTLRQLELLTKEYHP